MEQFTFTLPVEIGSVLYQWCEWMNEMDKFKVSSLQQKANKQWKERLTNPRGFVHDTPMSDIGIKYFYTQQEAAEAWNRRD